MSSGGGGGATVTVANTAPSSPTEGALWIDSDYGDLNAYFSNSWVIVGGSGGLFIPTIANITGSVKNGYATTLTIFGNNLGLSAVTVRFSFGTMADVTVTPTSNTQLSVAVPASIYALAAGTAGNISIIDSSGRQSQGYNMTVELVLDGSTSAKAAASPYSIRLAIGSTPTAGVYWFKNAGYNSGTAFQAYADWSTDNVYGMMVICGYNMTDASAVSFTDFGTAATTLSGTAGFRTTHYLPTKTILNNWSGDTRNRSYLGMISQTGGTTIDTATSKQWILMNLTFQNLANMFDDAPTVGQFSIDGGIVTTSTGASGRIYYTTSHGSSIYQMSNSSADSVNASLWFETRVGGSDTNHTPCVWAAGNGTYYGATAPFTSRWMFIAISPDNR